VKLVSRNLLAGINCTSPYTLPLVCDLLDERVADFCELMVDNFIHLPADKIREALPDAPISLHIVASRFMERSPADLNALAQRLREWIAVLKPMYVSDHLARFSSERGRLPMLAELDYAADYLHIKTFVEKWQEQLGTVIFFENFASLTSTGNMQADFFKQLQQDTGAGLLFDYSNAYIAEYNNVLPLSAWDSLLEKVPHFHAAGFRIDPDTGLAIDTHDIEIDPAVYAAMRRNVLDNKTIVIEFDKNQKKETWQECILTCRQQLNN